MKLEEIRCKSCGAKLEVEEDAEMVTCPYCNNTYKIEDEDMENSGYEFEKGRIKAQKEQMESATMNHKWIIVLPILIASIVMFIVVNIAMMNMRKSANNFGSSTNSVAKKNIESSDSFNIYLSSGRKYCIFLEDELERIITSNKTHDEKQIIVKYNGAETNNPDEIKQLKKSLNRDKEYEVTLDYDNEGYINVYTIEDI